ncbi:MAG: short-chain dehydrogenase, partial [Mesorhizobium sp.]
MQMKSEIAGEAAKQRHIQRGIDAKDKTKGKGKQQGAMQAGARKYPEPPFP